MAAVLSRISSRVTNHSSLPLPIRTIPAKQLFKFGDIPTKDRVKIFAFFRSHVARVRHDIAILVANPPQRPYTEEPENRVECLLLLVLKLLEPDNHHLLSREKFENAFELLGVKSSID